jgi:hypothetical protein
MEWKSGMLHQDWAPTIEERTEVKRVNNYLSLGPRIFDGEGA